jgi:hypothetical protein
MMLCNRHLTGAVGVNSGDLGTVKDNWFLINLFVISTGIDNLKGTLNLLFEGCCMVMCAVWMWGDTWGGLLLPQIQCQTARNPFAIMRLGDSPCLKENLSCLVQLLEASKNMTLLKQLVAFIGKDFLVAFSRVGSDVCRLRKECHHIIHTKTCCEPVLLKKFADNLGECHYQTVVLSP